MRTQGRGRAGEMGSCNTRAAQGAMLAAAMLALLSLGCGSKEAPKPSGPSMTQVPAERSGNRPPVVESVRLDPASPKPDQVVRAIAKGSDPDGDPVQFKYQWRIGSRTLSDTGNQVTLKGVAKGTPLEVSVVADDGRAESQPLVVTGSVGNQPPQLVAVALEPVGAITAGNPVVAHPQATDPDGDEIHYHYAWWVNGHEAGGDDPTLDTSKLRRGDMVKVRVVATDGIDESNAIESPPMRVANAPPKIVSTPSGFDRDGKFRYTIEAVDPDGDKTLRFHLVKGPEGMTVDSLSGLVQWKPSPTQTGKQAVEVAVDDLQGGTTSQRFELTVGTDQAQASATPGTENPPSKPASAPTSHAPTPLAPGAGTADATRSPEPTRGSGAPVPKAQRTQPPPASGEEVDEEAGAAAAPQPSHPPYRHHGGPAGAPAAPPAEGEGAE